MTTRVLIAPDKFKGTLSAREVAEALGAGFASSLDVRLLPLADGGDGSLEAAYRAGFELVELDPTIATATSKPARIARKGDVFFVESAEFCGPRHPRSAQDPLSANTLGVGLAVKAALGLGARTIVLGVGGTASTDGGVGFLTGLGANFLTEAEEPIALGSSGLSALSIADFSELDERIANVEIILASDVDSPLLGSAGAARQYAPQKGATAAQVEVLALGIEQVVKILKMAGGVWAERTKFAIDAPGSGAGGGLGFATLLLGATRVSGADYFLDLLDFDTALGDCDVVVTGEGCLDEQSLAGKLPIVLAARARALHIPVIAVVGKNQLNEDERARVGISRIYVLDQRDPRCVDDPELSKQLLMRIGEEISLRSFRDAP